MSELTGYQLLANGIVEQAAKDYRELLKRPYHTLTSKEKWEKIKIERFFRSDWYKLLTKVDGEMIIERLKEEVNNDRQ